MLATVIAPHVDDAEIGCGSYLARRRREGWETRILVVALSDVWVRVASRVVTAKEREDEMYAAAKVLGAKVWALKMRENELPLESMGEMVMQIENWLDSACPDELLIPLPSSNQDHRTVHQACMAAIRYRPKTVRLTKVMAYGLPGQEERVGSPCYLEVEEDDLKRQMLAMAEHKSQSLGRVDCTYGMTAVMAQAHAVGMVRGMPRAIKFDLVFEAEYRSLEIVR